MFSNPKTLSNHKLGLLFPGNISRAVDRIFTIWEAVGQGTTYFRNGLLKVMAMICNTNPSRGFSKYSMPTQELIEIHFILLAGKGDNIPATAFSGSLYRRIPGQQTSDRFSKLCFSL